MKNERTIKHEPPRDSKNKEGITITRRLLTGKLTKRLRQKQAHKN